MTRHTLTVPLTLNNGSPTPRAELRRIERQLASRFGGWTSVDGRGGWRDPDNGTTYAEAVRRFEIDTADPGAAEGLESLAATIARRLEQEAVYLTEQPITTTLVRLGATTTS